MNPHRDVAVQYVYPAGPERELVEQCDDLVLKAASDQGAARAYPGRGRCCVVLRRARPGIAPGAHGRRAERRTDYRG